MTDLKLFKIQDFDGDMWVVASDYQEAVTRFKMYVAKENQMEIHEVDEPTGIQYICDSEQLLLESQL